jgi:glycosyltransferase involved in cell wall biosynthesis
MYSNRPGNIMGVNTIAVIPAYNEANMIGPVIDETANHVDSVAVVDDASMT